MPARRSTRAPKPKGLVRDTSDEDAGSDPELKSSNVVLKAHPVVEDERQAKIQEKNRRAQRKFRERRKEKMCHMEKSIAKLGDQIETLKVENKLYKNLLTVKEQELHTLKSGVPQTAGTLVYPDYDPIDMSWLPGFGAKLLSNEKIRHMKDEELFVMCVRIFNMLDQELRACEASGSNTVFDHSRVDSLVKGGTSFWARCLRVEPVRTREVVGRIQAKRKQDSFGLHQGSSDKMASSMIARLGLTPEQMRQMSMAWMKYKAALEHMLGDREACSKELMSLRPDPDHEMRNLQIFLQENKVVEQLRSTMQRENSLFLECMYEVANSTLSPMQLARFILHGEPYMDMLSLCKAVAVQMEGEDTAKLSAKARQRSVLCTALDNLDTLDPMLQTDLKALGGRVQVAEAAGPFSSMPFPSLPLPSLGSFPTSVDLGPFGSQHRSPRGLGGGEVGGPPHEPIAMPAFNSRPSLFKPVGPGPVTSGSLGNNMLPSGLLRSGERWPSLGAAGPDLFASFRPTTTTAVAGSRGFSSALMPQGLTASEPEGHLFAPSGGATARGSALPAPSAAGPAHMVNTTWDDASPFTAPGVNGGSGSLNLGDQRSGLGAGGGGAAGAAQAARPSELPNGETAGPSLDLFAGYEGSPSLLTDNNMMSRFTSTSLHLMESCELHLGGRRDTLMNMIDRMPFVTDEQAAAALEGGTGNQNGHASNRHANSPPITTGGNMYFGQLRR